MQDDEEQQQESVPSPMATPQSKNSVKQSDKGKQPMNPVSGNEKQQAKTAQNKSIDTNNLEKVVTVSNHNVSPKKIKNLIIWSNKIKPSVYQKS